MQVGPVTLTLDPEAFMQFVDMVSTSAANFEVWLQLKNGKTPEAWLEGARKESPCEEKEQ
ncbi:MAG: hypothetical protein WDO18_06865 [Acidobacteriota bacterium]